MNLSDLENKKILAREGRAWEMAGKGGGVKWENKWRTAKLYVMRRKDGSIASVAIVYENKETSTDYQAEEMVVLEDGIVQFDCGEGYLTQVQMERDEMERDVTGRTSQEITQEDVLFVVTNTNSDAQTEIISIHKTYLGALRAAKESVDVEWNDLDPPTPEPQRKDFESEEDWLEAWIDDMNEMLREESPEGVDIEPFNLME